jgi:hypothetical protein
MQRKVNDVLDILVYLLQILEEADLDDDDSLSFAEFEHVSDIENFQSQILDFQKSHILYVLLIMY